MKDITDLVGRLWLSAIFFFEAIDTSTSRSVTYDLMSRYGFTWQQDFLYNAAIFALVLGAILVAIGYRTGFGATLILIYWLPVTFAVYSFWMTDASHRNFEMVMFMKNLSIAGGLLILAANGAGKYSIKRLLATTRIN
jgi:putative oxidoreductase